MAEQAPSMQPDLDPASQVQATPDQDGGADYDRLMDPADDLADHTVEGAAVRPEAEVDTAAQEANRQASISAADRQNREDAGLPPRVHDLT